MSVAQQADLRELLRVLAEAVEADALKRRQASTEHRRRGYARWRRSEYVSVNEAAAALDVDASTVKRRIYNGKIPAERFERTWLIRRSDLACIIHTPSTGQSTRKTQTFAPLSSSDPQTTRVKLRAS